ncbi:MAG: carboxypeptidase regulatory-like domain-containing protein [Candidatus Edwardsbacteria bacterium]|nr:carboxypeptidase regulatory-like domain-containing protein [Candidatus Edwardsbacteria bacterium]
MRILILLSMFAAFDTPGLSAYRLAAAPPAEYDLAVVSIDTPAAYVPPDKAFTPAITIRNAGMYSVADFKLFFSIADSTGAVVYFDSLAVSNTLNPDSVRQEAFPDSFAPLASMNYLAMAFVVLAEDGYHYDDTLSKPFSTFQYNDLSVASIDTPAAFVVAPGVSFYPAATIHNRGTYDEGGFGAYYTIQDSLGFPVYSDTLIVSSLAMSMDTSLVFDSFTPDSFKKYRATAFTALAGDAFPGNDTLRLDFRTFEYAGAIGGLVTDENEGNAPLANAVVTAVSGGSSFYDTTDVSGNYSFVSLPIGIYDLTAGNTGYVDSTVHGIVVTIGANLSQDFSLGYPSLALTPPDLISVLLSPGSVDSSRFLVLQNTGTRPMYCEITWPEKAAKSFSDSVWGLDIESKVADNLCLGAEFDGQNLWVTGAAGSPSADPNYLYKLDRNGNLLASYLQPAGSGWGWRDLCWDGQYLYAASNSSIMQIDTANGDTTGARIASPCAVARGLAHDPASDRFFAADFSDSIYEINRSGAVINAWSNTKSVFGLAWDATAPDGPWLWVFSTDTSGSVPRPFLRQFDPRSGVYTGTQFMPGTIDSANAAAGGLAFSTSFIHGRGTLIALIQDDRDRLAAYDIRPENAAWLSLSGTSLALAPLAYDSVRLTFSNIGLDSLKDYFAYVKVTSNAPNRADSVLAILRSPYEVAGNKPEPPGLQAFALLPCRPNPARDQAAITFSLPRAGYAELAIYNVAGQRVRTLASGNMQAGWHTAIWNGRDDRGQRVSSGVYLYRLRVDEYQNVRKMILLR